MKTLLAAPFLAAALACGASPAAQAPVTATPSASADSALKTFGEAKVGDHQKCIISGEEFTVAESSPKAEVNGKTYYFCCAGCAKKFQANPATYLAKPGT